MESENYDFIYKIERENWWYSAKRHLIEKILEKSGRKFESALDIGCGVGANTEVLERFSKKTTGVDISKKAIDYAKQKHPSSRFLLANATKLPFAKNSFDMVLCSEVIEHVDDRKAIKEIHRVLKPGGLLMLTVPAHMRLWNFNDRFSHHLRRYELNEVKSLLGDKFKIKNIGHWNLVSYLPARILARLNNTWLGKKNTNNLYLVPRFMNKALLGILKIENALFTRNVSFDGVSVVCVAERV